jgi:phosphatidylserine decarboxylase
MTEHEKAVAAGEGVKWAWPAVHPEGRKFALISAAVVAGFWVLGWTFISWLFVGLTIWILAFFRDPIRSVPQDPNAIYLQAAAEEATAKAAQARASTVKTVADAELSRAKTVETLANIDMDSQDHAMKMMADLVPAEQIQKPPFVNQM